MQTLCTLRFADRVKRVKMKAVVCDTLDTKEVQSQMQALCLGIWSLFGPRGMQIAKQQTELRLAHQQTRQRTRPCAFDALLAGEPDLRFPTMPWDRRKEWCEYLLRPFPMQTAPSQFKCRSNSAASRGLCEAASEPAHSFGLQIAIYGPR